MKRRSTSAAGVKKLNLEHSRPVSVAACPRFERTISGGSTGSSPSSQSSSTPATTPQPSMLDWDFENTGGSDWSDAAQLDRKPIVLTTEDLHAARLGPGGKLRLRDWLVGQVASGSVPGLRWVDEEKSLVRVPWIHKSKSSWTRDAHSQLFESWASYTGKYRPGVDAVDTKRWKANFRCAINSLDDVREETRLSSVNGLDGYKVYRLLPAPTNSKSLVNGRKVRRRRNLSANASSFSSSQETVVDERRTSIVTYQETEVGRQLSSPTPHLETGSSCDDSSAVCPVQLCHPCHAEVATDDHDGDEQPLRFSIDADNGSELVIAWQLQAAEAVPDGDLIVENCDNELEEMAREMTADTVVQLLRNSGCLGLFLTTADG